MGMHPPALLSAGCDPSPLTLSSSPPFRPGFPPRAVFSLLHRALHQAARMRRFAARSHGALQLITSRAQLDAYVANRTSSCLAAAPSSSSSSSRRRRCDFTAGVLGVEGAHALEGDVRNLDVLHDAGFRLMGLQHFADNAAGGSAHGTHRGGLTPWGRQLLGSLASKGWVVDLAHSSREVIADAIAQLAATGRPFLVSHTGAGAVCGGQEERALSDDQLRDVASAGGVVGVGYWKEVTCGTTVDAVADVIMHVVSVAGARAAALGSDWDGGVAVPPGLDAGGVAQVTGALRARGLDGQDLADVMGGNALRVFRASLK